MSDLANARPEAERMAFITQRDGPVAARDWAERTLGIYREALQTPGSHAMDVVYRALFVKSVEEFEEWLAANQE